MSKQTMNAKQTKECCELWSRFFQTEDTMCEGCNDAIHEDDKCESLGNTCANCGVKQKGVHGNWHHYVTLGVKEDRTLCGDCADEHEEQQDKKKTCEYCLEDFDEGDPEIKKFNCCDRMVCIACVMENKHACKQ